MTCLIGTGVYAGAAADAGFIVDDHRAFLCLPGRSGRADVHAGRIVTVHAHGQHITLSGILTLPVFHLIHRIVVDAGPRAVAHLAGDNTGVAADAAIQVQYHAVLAHCFSSFFPMFFITCYCVVL